jgi:hypothetical protein
MAEKLVTMIDRGAATTRERDFADVLLLTRRHSMEAADLLAALQATLQSGPPRAIEGYNR